ncbi:MAG TPA: glucose-1-phosphate cytidylyltransferase [Ignavibacteria bacterium]|nr:glucose-1-phosphate cytidylyltransferase [Ignavibacteria bacterium]
MKVVLLCGGLGTRLKEETEYKPKPMVEIGGRPILWHIMKTYSYYGFNKFVLCLGYRGDSIKDYFCNYESRNNDFTLKLGTNEITTHNQHSEYGWEITFADTGLSSMTGSRVKRIEKYIDDDIFMLTYGDGVSDVDIKKLLEFHRSHGKTATITGVLPPSRFGELLEDKGIVKSFNEKPQIHAGGLISGGYFVFNRKIFDYLSDDEDCILERLPMEELVNDKQLCVYKHEGFWQCMDTFRDFEFLNTLWKEGNASWKIWN